MQIKQKITLLALAVSALLATGCASTNYTQYVESNKAIAIQQSKAQVARVNALKEVATSGDANTRNMAIMALALGNNQDAPTQALEAPRDPLLQWAGILVPSLTTFAVKGLDTVTAIQASNNNVKVEGIRYGTINNIAVEGIKGAKLPLEPITLTPPVPVP